MQHSHTQSLQSVVTESGMAEEGLLHVLMMDALSNQEIMVKIIRTCLRNLESKNNVKRKEN